MGTKTTMCRYHVMGSCRNGASCPFSHDNARADSFVCPYFAKGHCAYGDKCMYDHRLPSAAAQPPSRPAVHPAPAHTGTSAQARDPALGAHSSTAAERSSTAAGARGQPESSSTAAAQTEVPVAKAAKDSPAANSGAQTGGKDKSLPICAYYAQGLCNFGDACRFRHEDASDAANASAALEALSVTEQRAAATKNLVSLGRVPQASANEDNNSGAVLSSPSACERGVDTQSRGSSAQNGAGSQQAAGGGRSTQALRIAPPPERPAWREAPPKQPAEGLTIFDANVDLLDPWEVQRTGAQLRPAEGGAPDATREAWCEQWTMCGECERGEECPLVHGEQCITCQYFALHPSDAAARDAHEQACADAFVREQRRQDSAEMECGICMELVLGERGRKFGLLACDHCFCLPCIRNWRATHISATDDDATRVCPLCRTLTHYVTPCAYWPQTEEEKAQAVGDYKRHLAAVPCRNFDQGRGECPFGSSCFYRHAYPDGSLEEHRLADARMATNSAGEYKPVQELTLSSFLDTARSQRLMRRGRRR